MKLQLKFTFVTCFIYWITVLVLYRKIQRGKWLLNLFTRTVFDCHANYVFLVKNQGLCSIFMFTRKTSKYGLATTK